MCGILAIIGKGKEEVVVQQLAKRMRHRGPDESDIQITEKGHVLAHERLSIVDIHTGKQPIQGTHSAWMVHNGEIYNHKVLRETTLKQHSFRTTSDSEVIVHLFEEFGYDFCDMLDGIFAFVVVDGDDYMASKDKAIKKAMGKDKAVKENLKAIITKVLEEDQINEAATNVLAAFGDDYAGFDGMKSAINALENIVTDIEQYYDKTRNKIQKVYDTLGEIRNEEGLKVGGFLAPAVEQAFNRDLRPVIKQGFTKALDMPQVKKLAKPGMAQETEAPKQTVFGLNEKKK
jgi:hypothetical protein